MPTIIVPISEELLTRLQATAARRGITLEEMMRAGVEEMLERLDAEGSEQTDFDQVADYVLKKNVELYRRLA
jgi:hypothetical protein